MPHKTILSFDVEEFDTPLEYGKNLSMDEQMHVSETGLRAVLGLLEAHQVTATFFTTANFALHYPELVRQISRTHEIASHGYYHSSFGNADLQKSRDALENIIKKPVTGYRMARMMPVDELEIARAGYLYNSSLHPTFVPGRYNHLSKPRTPFWKAGVLQIPASVTPGVRFPVFWLSFKNFPLPWIKLATRSIWHADGCVNLYFHPWEFADISDKDRFGLPFYVSRHSADGAMLRKLELYVVWAKKHSAFTTFAGWYQTLAARPLPGYSGAAK